jgi:hypothetical protein
MFEIHSNIQFHEKPRCGSQARSMQIDGQTKTDMMKPTLAFLNSANMPKKALRIGDLAIMSLWIIDYNSGRFVNVIITGSTNTRSKE